MTTPKTRLAVQRFSRFVEMLKRDGYDYPTVISAMLIVLGNGIAAQRDPDLSLGVAVGSLVRCVDEVQEAHEAARAADELRAAEPAGRA